MYNKKEINELFLGYVIILLVQSTSDQTGLSCGPWNKTSLTPLVSKWVLSSRLPPKLSIMSCVVKKEKRGIMYWNRLSICFSPAVKGLLKITHTFHCRRRMLEWSWCIIIASVGSKQLFGCLWTMWFILHQSHFCAGRAAEHLLEFSSHL